MSATPEHPVVGGDSGFATELDELERQLTTWRGASGDDPGMEALLEELGTAYEELRVADEEVRNQQRQLSAFAERERLVTAQQERMMTLLPVAVIGTDRCGKIRSANAAAAELTGRGVVRLVGRPVVNLVSVQDRGVARTLLRPAEKPTETDHPVVTVVARDKSEIRVHLFTWSPVTTSSTVWWLFLPVDRLDRGPSPSDGDLPAALSRLALLPGAVDTR